MQIKILPNAVADLELGADFYESQRPGLGGYFLHCLVGNIDSLQQVAGVHEKYLGFHRLIAKRFPFAVFYRIEDKLIRIFAVLDLRQNPTKLATRLKSEE